MWAAWALMLGGVLRIVGETLEVIAGVHTDRSGLLAGAGLILIAIGFCGLWRDVRISRIGQLAVLLLALGAMGFSAIAAWSVSQGTLPLGVVAQMPVFVVAALVTLSGAMALAVWLIRSPAYPVWIGVVMSVSIALSLASSFVALPSLVQPLIDMVMALTFIQLGLSMREQRKKVATAP